MSAPSGASAATRRLRSASWAPRWCSPPAHRWSSLLAPRRTASRGDRHARSPGAAPPARARPGAPAAAHRRGRRDPAHESARRQPLGAGRPAPQPADPRRAPPLPRAPIRELAATLARSETTAEVAALFQVTEQAVHQWASHDKFPADRDAAHAILAAAPQARQGARENRAFLQRAVRFLAAEAGIRQFLDIGTGLPTQGNVHQVAQAVAPDARVVYADHDPVVYAHANALLADHTTTTTTTTTTTVLADLRAPEMILGQPEVRRLLDFTQPVALLLVAVLHFVRDEEDPAGLVARLREALAPGSYVGISHATADFHPQAAAKITDVYQQASAPLVLRSRNQIARLFDGFDLLAPGLVQPAAWRPDGERPAGPGSGGFYGGVGRRS